MFNWGEFNRVHRYFFKIESIPYLHFVHGLLERPHHFSTFLDDLNFGYSNLPFDLAQGGELVEPFRISGLSGTIEPFGIPVFKYNMKKQ